MPGTVTPILTTIHDCDSVSDWTGSPTLDSEVFIQGAGSLSAKISKTTLTFVKPITAVDLSDTILYIWVMGSSISQFNTKANGGIRIRVQEGTNWGEWYVAGSDVGYEGGWQCLAIRTTQSFEGHESTPAPNKALIDAVGVVFNVTAGAAKINCWWDAVRYGTGLNIKGGTEGSPASFADIVTAEEEIFNRWGIVVETEGVLMVQGQLTFGSTIAGETTYFKDVSKILVFRDRAFGTFYELKVQGNGTGETKVYFGTKSGAAGISGCVFRSAGTSKFKFTAIDASITALGVYGCLFLDADTISLPAYSATREVLNTNFEMCAVVLLSTCIIENCNFISADDAGARVTDTSDPPNFKNSNFISCPYGVRIPNTGTYKFDNLKFSGSFTAHIDNTSSGLVTVNCVNNANPTTYTGNTDINNYVDVTVTVKDEAQTNIEGASVRVSKLDDNAVVYMNEVTDINGIATESINYPGAVSLRIRVRKSSVSGTRYIPMETTGVMTGTGFSLTVTLYEDGNIS